MDKLKKMRSIQLTQPLTEKSRPTCFDEIIGQEEGIKALKAALCGPNPQHVIIYGPPGVGKTAAARLVLEEAKKYNKSVVQIVFKWLLQQNVIIIPKTWDLNHLKENISLYDFELTNEEMAVIDSIDKGRFLNYNPYEAIQGYKKFFKVWDGFKK